MARTRMWKPVIALEQGCPWCALEAAGLKYTLAETVVMELLDRPGELSKVARRLARNGVNVESIYILGTKDGTTEIAIVASDVDKAKRAIG